MVNADAPVVQDGQSENDKTEVKPFTGVWIETKTQKLVPGAVRGLLIL